MSRDVVVLDYGSGNVRSAVRALEHVGARVRLTADREAALGAAGLFVPGVGNFHACMAGLAAADGPYLIDHRLAGSRPVLGVCVGMQVMFEGSTEPSAAPVAGVGEWPGTVSRLEAPVVPHMGWSTVEVPTGNPASTAIPNRSRSTAGPMPDSINSWADPIAPLHKTIRSAARVSPPRHSTPTARAPSRAPSAGAASP